MFATSLPVVAVILLPFSVTDRSAILERKVMSKEMPPQGCTPPAVETTRFLSTDSRAILWFSAGQVNRGDVLSREWYDPSGTLYARGTWDPAAASGGYCYTIWLDIAGRDAAAKPGNWRVEVRVNNAAFFQQAFTIELAASPPDPVRPSISSGGVVGGIDGGSALAPGSLISIQGTNLAPSAASAPTVPLPVTLNGVSVDAVDAGRTLPVPLFSVSPGRINALLPYGITGASVGLRVRNGAQVSNDAEIAVWPAAPVLMTNGPNGTGEAVALHGDLRPVSAAAPAGPSEVILLDAVGLGAVDPAVDAGRGGGDGSAGSPVNRVLAPVEVSIDNLPAIVVSAALVPRAPGVYRITVRMPNTVSAGPVPVVIRAGASPARASQAGAVIQAAARPAAGISPEEALRKALEAQARGDLDAMIGMCSPSRFDSRSTAKAREILETIRSRVTFRDFAYRHRVTAFDETETAALARAEVSFTAFVNGAEVPVAHGIAAEMHKEADGWRLGHVFPDDALNLEIHLRRSTKSAALRRADLLSIAEFNRRLDEILSKRHINHVKTAVDGGAAVVGAIPLYGDVPAYIYQVGETSLEMRELIREYSERGFTPMLTLKGQQVAAGMLQIAAEALPGFDTVTDAWAISIDNYVFNIEVQRLAQELKARSALGTRRFSPVMTGGFLNWDLPVGALHESAPSGALKLFEPLSKITLERPALGGRIPVLVYDELVVPTSDDYLDERLGTPVLRVMEALGAVRIGDNYHIPLNLTAAVDFASLLPAGQGAPILGLPSFDPGPAGEGTVLTFRISCHRGTQILEARLYGGEKVSGPVVTSRAMNEVQVLELTGAPSGSLDLAVGQTRGGLGVTAPISGIPPDGWPDLTAYPECLSAKIADTKIATVSQGKDISVTGVAEGSTTLNLTLAAPASPPPLEVVHRIPVQVKKEAANPASAAFAIFAAFDGWHLCNSRATDASGTREARVRCSPFDSRMYVTNQLNLSTSNYEQAVPPALRITWNGLRFTAKGSASGSYSGAGASDTYTIDFSGTLDENARAISSAKLIWQYRTAPGGNPYVAVTNAEIEIRNLPLGENDARWPSAYYYATGPAALAAMKINKYETVTTWPDRTNVMTYLSSDPAVTTNALVFIRGAR